MIQIAKALDMELEEMITLGGNLSAAKGNVIHLHTNHGTVSPVVNNTCLPLMGEISRDICEQIARKMAMLSIDKQIELRSMIKDALKRIDDMP